MKDKRDALDYGEMRIPKLFRKLFFPTLLGLVSSVLLNLADGIFVGRGVGSDALAAINIVAPMFQIATGIALMLGSGMSIVAAVHLSKNNVKAANINMTQAFTVGILMMGIIVTLSTLFPHQTAALFGGSERLYPLAHDYIIGIGPCLIFMTINMIGLFAIRLDGSPNYAMAVNTVGAGFNILLDWVFVFPLKMGIAGAAIATSISAGIGTIMVIWYFARKNKILALYKPKFSRTAIGLTIRNCGYMLKLGFPTFIAETAISCMIITGNYVFMRHIGEDGVAAFSVACYLFPMIFMFGNAIAQSSLPIVSYNYGLHNDGRIRETFKLSVLLATGLGILMSIFGFVFAEGIVNLFLDKASPANQIGVKGIPLFLLTCLPFTLNVVLIGYLQSLELYLPSTVFMLLRGLIFVVPCFVIFPMIAGEKGLWIAEPISEMATLILLIIYISYRLKKHKTITGTQTQ